MSTNATLAPAAGIAVKAERHGGRWFTYDADGFVVEAGLSVNEAADAVHAGKQGQTREQWEEAERLYDEERARKWAGLDW